MNTSQVAMQLNREFIKLSTVNNKTLKMILKEIVNLIRFFCEDNLPLITPPDHHALYQHSQAKESQHRATGY